MRYIDQCLLNEHEPNLLHTVKEPEDPLVTIPVIEYSAVEYQKWKAIERAKARFSTTRVEG